MCVCDRSTGFIYGPILTNEVSLESSQALVVPSFPHNFQGSSHFLSRGESYFQLLASLGVSVLGLGTQRSRVRSPTRAFFLFLFFLFFLFDLKKGNEKSCWKRHFLGYATFSRREKLLSPHRIFFLIIFYFF